MLKRTVCFVSVFILFLYLSFVSATENIPQRKLRFFCLDIHGSVSADIKQIFEELGHEVVIWAAPTGGIGYSLFTHGQENDLIEVFNFDSWRNCDIQMYENFYARYKDFLNQFDGYIAAFNSSFALFYQNLNKPIIIINAVRYEFPFTGKPELWESLNNFLINGVNSRKIFIVANNRADQKYLKHYTGLNSEFIPSLCLYTKAKYSGKKDRFICQPTKRYPELNNLIAQKCPKYISNEISFPYQWQDLYDYKGIIHFPYQVSTMSLFEQYSANVPLFFPSKEFLIKLRQKNSALIGEASCALFLPYPPLLPTPSSDLNNLSNPHVIRFWIDNADFYDKANMPYIQYFNSFTHLKLLLETVNVKYISQRMKAYNRKRKKIVFEKWKSLLQQVMDVCE